LSSRLRGNPVTACPVCRGTCGMGVAVPDRSGPHPGLLGQGRARPKAAPLPQRAGMRYASAPNLRDLLHNRIGRALAGIAPLVFAGLACSLLSD